MSKRSSISLVHKLAFSILAGILVFSLVELVLAIVIPLPGPFECKAGPESGTRRCVFKLNRYQTAIQVPKPPSTYRIMIFGESGVEGWLELGFPAWLGEMARAGRPPVTVETINLGMSGASTTMIRNWFLRALDLEPDLVVLYLGNNDVGSYRPMNPAEHPLQYQLTNFLAQNSRIYSMLQTVTAGLVTSPAPDAETNLHQLTSRARTAMTEQRLAKASKLYRKNLEDMTQAARSRGVKVILMSPAANLRDWPPLNPSPGPGLPPDKIEQLGKKLAEARLALKLSNLAAARVALAHALDLDPTHALAHYLMAKVKEQEQDQAGAYEQYRLARQYDASFLRAPPGFAEINAEVAVQNGESFIDLDQRLREKTSSGIPGFDLFFDFLHFNLRGNYEVSSILFQELSREGDIKWGRPEVPPWEEVRGRLYSKNEEAIAKILEAAFLTRFSEQSEISSQAERLFGEAGALLPGDPLPALYQALLAAQRGNAAACRERLNAAYGVSPESASRTARRFFPQVLEIYQGQAVIFIDQARTWTGLANARNGWALSILPPLDFGTIPLRQASFIFKWNRGESGFIDDTARIKSWLDLNSPNTPPGNPVIDLLADPLRVRLNQLQPVSERRTFTALSGDSYLTIERLSIDPLATPRLIVEAAIFARGTADNLAELYWNSARDREFSEDRKLSFSFPADGQTRSIAIPLDRVVAIIDGGTISTLRFDFTSRPARIKLLRLELGGPEKKQDGK